MKAGFYKLDRNPARQLTDRIMAVVRAGVTPGLTHTEIEEAIYHEIDQYLNRPVWSGKVKPR